MANPSWMFGLGFCCWSELTTVGDNNQRKGTSHEKSRHPSERMGRVLCHLSQCPLLDRIGVDEYTCIHARLYRFGLGGVLDFPVWLGYPDGENTISGRVGR